MERSGRDRDTICPAWCERPAGHVAGSFVAGDTTHARLVAEIRFGETWERSAATDRPLRVAVEAWTDLDGREHPPTIRLTPSCNDGPFPEGDDLTPGEARELAAALLEAAAIAES